jgi:hypothetical protein
MGIEYNCWCERTDTSEIGFRLYGNYIYRIYIPCQTSIVAMKCSVLNMLAAERSRAYSYKCNVAELECEELPLNMTESIAVVCCSVCLC